MMRTRTIATGGGMYHRRVMPTVRRPLCRSSSLVPLGLPLVLCGLLPRRRPLV